VSEVSGGRETLRAVLCVSRQAPLSRSLAQCMMYAADIVGKFLAACGGAWLAGFRIFCVEFMVYGLGFRWTNWRLAPPGRLQLIFALFVLFIH
jgi:hypothetical protein